MSVENLGIFKSRTRFEIAPLTILTGPNSSGKSTVLNTLKLLRDSADLPHPDLTEHGRLFMSQLRFGRGRHGFTDFHDTLNRSSDDGTIRVSIGMKDVTLRWQTLPGWMAGDGDRYGLFGDKTERNISKELEVDLEYDSAGLRRVRLNALQNDGRLCTFADFAFENSTTAHGGSAAIRGKIDYSILLAVVESSIRSVAASRVPLYSKTDESPEKVEESLNVGFESNYNRQSSGVGLEGLYSDIMWNLPIKYKCRDILNCYFLKPVMKSIVESLYKTLSGLHVVPHRVDIQDNYFSVSSRTDIEGYESSFDFYIHDMRAYMNELSRQHDIVYNHMSNIDRLCQEYGISNRLQINVVNQPDGRSAAGLTVSLNTESGVIPLHRLGRGHLRLLLMSIAIIGPQSAGLRRKRSLMVEEPEANLHPRLQSRLADFFVRGLPSFSDAGNEQKFFALNTDPRPFTRARPLIVETHSPYFIKRLQILVGKGRVRGTDIALHYLTGNHQSGETHYMIELDDNGKLSRPFGPGFTDELTGLALQFAESDRKN